MTALEYSHSVRTKSPLRSYECGTFVCVFCVCAYVPLTKTVPDEMLNPLTPHSRLLKAGAPQDQVQCECLL